MKGTTAGRGLPPAGIFRAGTGEGCGLGRSNCKGYLNLQLDWLLREATARDAGTQLRALTRCAPALDAARCIYELEPERLAGGSQRRTSELSDWIDSSSSRCVVRARNSSSVI